MDGKSEEKRWKRVPTDGHFMWLGDELKDEKKTALEGTRIIVIMREATFISISSRDFLILSPLRLCASVLLVKARRNRAYRVH